ncbi:capsid morphogenesis B protein [Staphylococcus equorum]|uniref:capsid morphogenesis B protein n=1 Tax=Staphylococcus equorum TaxID=246432 RepID=UPI002404EB8F|nr:capsid morphogenesis B protein [Staphylococcus equorum]MDG0837318.1 capsid morphogenesis B protein [Staphylococcus equorum]
MEFNYSIESTEKAAKVLKLSAEDKQALIEAVNEDFKQNMTEVAKLKNKEARENKQETKQEQQQSIMKMARNARVIKS